MSPRKYLLDNESAQAQRRFDSLATLFDPVTRRHLEAVGIAAGWQCWEVGAGGPSVPSWLAGRVGATGRVLASDVDVRWLPATDGFEVLQHDVAQDHPPEGSFDLVHARIVLTHIADRDVALRRMVQALRPGGWLVIEDFDVDFQPCATPDASRPEHYLANRIRAGFTALLNQRGVDLEFGRKLPRLLREAGLVDVGADGYFPLAQPAVATLEASNVEQVREALIEWRVASGDEVDDHVAAICGGSIDVATPPLISAWGRLPTV